MLKTYLYIPEHINNKINQTAAAQKKPKAEIIRRALEEGFEAMERQKNGGTDVLLALSEYAKKYKVKGPKDLSVNHDYYLWGLPKRNQKTKQ